MQLYPYTVCEIFIYLLCRYWEHKMLGGIYTKQQQQQNPRSTAGTPKVLVSPEKYLPANIKTQLRVSHAQILSVYLSRHTELIPEFFLTIYFSAI